MRTTSVMRHMPLMAGVAAALLLSSGSAAWALPGQGRVVAGASTIVRQGPSAMQIHQTTDKAVIDWQTYSIGAGEEVRYLQPGAGSISLNRVVGADPTVIQGRLSANGQVWVINPNGLLVGNGAKINVGGFLASTLNISNEDFLKGDYLFRGPNTASIINQGEIAAAKGGYVVLISPSIRNEGGISATEGKAYLASGDEVALNFAGNELVGFSIDRKAAEQALGIENLGRIAADGGEVILSADVAGDLVKTVVNNQGVIEARTIEKKNGVIRLLGGHDNGRVEVGGVLDASAPDGGDGGFIETSGADVVVSDHAKIDLSAPFGKPGTWLIDPNVALGAFAWSSVITYVGGGAHNVTDGDSHTFWHPAKLFSFDEFDYLQVQLDDTYSVSTITVETYSITWTPPSSWGNEYSLSYGDGYPLITSTSLPTRTVEIDPSTADFSSCLCTPGYYITDTWNVGGAPVRNVRLTLNAYWTVGELRVFNDSLYPPPSTDTSPPTAETTNVLSSEEERTAQEWLKLTTESEEGAAEESDADLAARADMNRVGALLDKLFNIGSMTPQARENLLAHLQKYLQRLTPEQAARVILRQGDPLENWVARPQDLEAVRRWVKENYTDYYREQLRKAEKEGAKESWIKKLKEELARYEQVDNNLRAMLQTRRLEDAFLAAFHGHERLTPEQRQALEKADPALRKMVAESILRGSEGFDDPQVRQQYEEIARSVEEGTLDKKAEQLAAWDEHLREVWAKLEKERLRRLDAEAEREFVARRADERTQALVAVVKQVADIPNFVDHFGTGSRFEQQAKKKIRDIYNEMLRLHEKMQKNGYSSEDQARFDHLRIEAFNLADAVYQGGSDYWSGRSDDLKLAIKVAENTKNVSLQTLDALAFVAGPEAKFVAEGIKAFANGATTFIDSALVKKDSAAMTTFNTIMSTSINAIPGGESVKQKVAADLTKSLLEATQKTVKDVANGKVPEKDAEKHFVETFISKYGEAGLKRLIGDKDRSLKQWGLREIATAFYRQAMKAAG